MWTYFIFTIFMKNLFLLFLLLSSCLLNAQVVSDFLVDDAVDSEALRDLKCEWCEPGVRYKSRSRGLDIAYQTIGSSTYEKSSNSINDNLPELERLNLLVLKIKVPVLLKDNFKLIIGTSYRPEYYDFAAFTSTVPPEFVQIDSETMKSSAVQVLATQKLDKKRYWVFRAKAKYNGDYEGFINFDHRYRNYTISAMYGKKASSTLDWGVGLTLNHSFRRSFIALPIFQYNRDFNYKWGVEIFLPVTAKLRYNVNRETILLAGVNFGTRSYRIGVEQMINQENVAADYSVRHAEIQMGIELERQIIPWLWASARVGYQTNFRTEFEAQNEFARDFEVDPSNAPFIRLGVFVSPPDKIMSKN